MGDIFKAIGDGMSKVWNETTKEAGRVYDRNVKNAEKDFDDVAKSIHDHGIIGGAVTTFEKMSPGQLTGELVDDLGNIDPKTRQAIAGTVNIAAGLVVGGPGLLWTLEGFTEIGDAMSGPGKPSAQGQPATPQQGMAAAQRRQDEMRAEQPGHAQHAHPHDDAWYAARDAARHKAHDRTIYQAGYRDGAADARGHNVWQVTPEMSPDFIRQHPHLGFGPPRFGDDVPGAGGAGGAGGVTINVGGGDLQSTIDIYFGDDKTTAAKSKVSDILNNKSLSFEDMIFQLMLALQEDGQGEVEALAAQLDKEDATADAQRKKLDGELTDLNDKLGKETDPGKRQQLQNQIDQKKSEMQRFESKENTSRQKIVDELKNKIDKLTEMQQALSAVLNTMHENAMNTIRNIK